MRNKALREAVIAKGGGCHLCGGIALQLPGEHWVADHLVPVADGGQEVATNLAKAHSTCNKWRGAKPLSEAERARVAKRRRLELFIELG